MSTRVWRGWKIWKAFSMRGEGGKLCGESEQEERGSERERERVGIISSDTYSGFLMALDDVPHPT